jgi:hypothetical protein
MQREPLAVQKEADSILSIWEMGGIKKIEGHVNAIDLPDEKLHQFLDWDKPIGEQSDYVKEIMSKFTKEEKKDIVKRAQMQQRPGGVPTGEDVYNTFARKYMKTVSAEPKQRYRMGQQLASEELYRRGILGNAHLYDHTGSRAWVIFSDDVLKQLEKK